MKTKAIICNTFSLPIILYGLLFLTACNHENTGKYVNSWKEAWIVGSSILQNEHGQTFYWIKRNSNPIWERIEASVEGFSYQEGYEYNIEVEAHEIQDPPLDAASITYSLSKILSKEKKQSDLPRLTSNIEECSFQQLELYPDNVQDSVYLLQGDILLTEEQHNNIGTKAGCISDKTKYWSDNKVYYTFADDFTGKDKVLKAIKEWEQKTSLTFIHGTGYGNYIEFFTDPNGGSYSNLGKTGGKQRLSIAEWGDYGTAIHEIGHAIGLIHEQCRNDRDSYIIIYKDNILPEKLHNFNKYPAGSVQDIGPFDFNSIMLYSSFNSFSPSGAPTMSTRDGLYFIGQRTHLSDGDLLGISAIYGPPFHSIYYKTNIITDEVDNIHETYEYDAEYYVKIFADLKHTTPAVLQYPRTITIYKDYTTFNPTTERIITTTQSYNITIPAGESSYFIGRSRNIEKYKMSNPEIIDITTYSVSGYSHLTGKTKQ